MILILFDFVSCDTCLSPAVPFLTSAVTSVTKARQIYESLQKRGQTNAASVLHERLVACEAAEVLATKALLEMPVEKLTQILTLTKTIWNLFPVSLQVKLCQHKIFIKLLPELQAAIDKPESENAQKRCAESLADELSLKLPTGESFQVLNPKFSAAFECIVQRMPKDDEAESKLMALQDGDAGEEVSPALFGFDLEAAAGAAAKPGQKKETLITDPLLLDIQKSAKDPLSWTKRLALAVATISIVYHIILQHCNSHIIFYKYQYYFTRRRNFQKKEPIGEVGCCESRMAERSR